MTSLQLASLPLTQLCIFTRAALLSFSCLLAMPIDIGKELCNRNFKGEITTRILDITERNAIIQEGDVEIDRLTAAINRLKADIDRLWEEKSMLAERLFVSRFFDWWKECFVGEMTRTAKGQTVLVGTMEDGTEVYGVIIMKGDDFPAGRRTPDGSQR